MEGSTESNHGFSSAVDKQWTFELTPLQQNVYLRHQTVVDFTPVRNVRDGKTLGIHPIYNDDGLPNTGGFILEVEKHCQEASTNATASSDGKKLNPENDPSIQIPKPLSEKKVCLVCRERYADYLEHIAHPSHHKRMRSNPYTKYIQEMCDSIKKDDVSLFSISKRKLNEGVVVSSTDALVDPNRMPNKKRFIEKSSIQVHPISTKATNNSRNGEPKAIHNTYLN